ncbi:MAG: hypothetical protein WCF90_09280 [Methanomicrobiales archaeon]
MYWGTRAVSSSSSPDRQSSVQRDEPPVIIGGEDRFVYLITHSPFSQTDPVHIPGCDMVPVKGCDAVSVLETLINSEKHLHDLQKMVLLP